MKYPVFYVGIDFVKNPPKLDVDEALIGFPIRVQEELVYLRTEGFAAHYIDCGNLTLCLMHRKVTLDPVVIGMACNEFVQFTRDDIDVYAVFTEDE